MKCQLYKARDIAHSPEGLFGDQYFRYCSAVWHFCGPRNRNKLQHLNKRALRIVLDEKSLHYQSY